MAKVFITQKIPNAAIEYLQSHGIDAIMRNEVFPLSKNDLKNNIKNADVVICLLTDIIDQEIIDFAVDNGVKGFCNYAVGYNNIDVNYAKKRNIWVTNTPGVLTKTTAEMAWALLFSAARRIVEAHKFILDGKFRGWEATLLLGYDVSGKTLGIIGAGRIGTAFALMSAGFEMNVLYVDENTNSILEEKLNAKKVDLDTLLKKSDFISLHTPLTPETKYLINKDKFNLMKPNAILINTSRGTVINEKDLAEALKSKKIAYAGLDVFENEPLIEKELLNLGNVVLAPHIASGTKETRDNMAIMAAKNAVDIIQTKKPQNNVY
ncbi:MAG TPA: D-glycerate dehydrogenase [bacterium]|nr:D-glycerate dehydrogenase [bacterium]